MNPQLPAVHREFLSDGPNRHAVGLAARRFEQAIERFHHRLAAETEGQVVNG